MPDAVFDDVHVAPPRPTAPRPPFAGGASAFDGVAASAFVAAGHCVHKGGDKTNHGRRRLDPQQLLRAGRNVAMVKLGKRVGAPAEIGAYTGRLGPCHSGRCPPES